MKKLIIISIVFALVIGAGVFETLYTFDVYSDIYDGLTKVQQSIDKHEDVYNEETVKLIDDTVDIWEKNKEILFCLGNHNVLRTVDEKLSSLKVMININYTDDAKVMIEVTLGLIDAIRNDAVPNPTNLF
ncbi:MAG: DUF4363 family protein [Clostridia bacterium]|nr:DUF4363 family protein [Clostridia bacterium]